MNLSNNKKLIRFSISILALIIATLGFFQYLNLKTNVYHCTDQRKKINIAIKTYGTGIFSKQGYLELLIHETDGNVYVLHGNVDDYSIFKTSFLYIPKKGNLSDEFPSLYGES